MSWIEIHVRVNGANPKSKKAIKDAVKSGATVTGESVSPFNAPVYGTLDSLPDGNYTFAGPDPFTRRNFYGQVIVSRGKVTVK
jgi:hypothetical protein